MISSLNKLLCSVSKNKAVVSVCHWQGAVLIHVHLQTLSVIDCCLEAELSGLCISGTAFVHRVF